jgi:hypothetical protein
MNPTARGNTRRYYFNRGSMKISERENIAHGKDILPFQLDFSHMRFERRGEMCVRLKCSMGRRFRRPILQFFGRQWRRPRRNFLWGTRA